MFPVLVTRSLQAFLSSVEKSIHSAHSGKLAGLCAREVSTDHVDNPPIYDTQDYESAYEQYKLSVSPDKTAIFQGIQRVPRADTLFYTTVSVENGSCFTALLDSGSMA